MARPPKVGMSAAALLLIDLINPFDFPGAEELLPHALQAARAIAVLKRRAHAAAVPVIYVNDNYDRWHVGFPELIEEFRAEGVAGLPLLDFLEPDPQDDHFILKPKHSGFYCTGLDVLLAHLGVRTLIITGIAGNICVLFTANDAHMRDYRLVVPADCCASERPADNEYALEQLHRVFGADVRPSPEIALEKLRDGIPDAPC